MQNQKLAMVGKITIILIINTYNYYTESDSLKFISIPLVIIVVSIGTTVFVGLLISKGTLNS